MAKRRKMPKALLEWRERQRAGAIMRPSTFERIVRKAAARGYRNPKAVAGKAYWTTVRAKYRKRRRGKTASTGFGNL
jgi:hypothetical protein